MKNTLAVAIRNAEITFDGDIKTTNTSGVAIFYHRVGNNLTYAVTADGYTDDDDEDNLIDVTAVTTKAITLGV